MPKWLLVAALSLAAVLLAAAVTWFIANAQYAARLAEAEAAWADIESRPVPASGVYDSTMVAGLPEIAQRYFNHAIAPGTPLFRRVVLEMEGDFHLGTKEAPQTFAMRARQILAPPEEFVWIADMRSGPVTVSGSDALYQGHAWTRFWMFRSLPLVQQAATEGLDRAALARPALEAIWAPASLLPQNGVRWEQTGPDKAQVTIGSGSHEVAMEMTIAADGRLLDIVTQRWSDANPDKVFRYQPFGGTVSAEKSFGGFTIPGEAHVGNFYGTETFFPFFEVSIVSARYF